MGRATVAVGNTVEKPKPAPGKLREPCRTSRNRCATVVVGFVRVGVGIARVVGVGALEGERAGMLVLRLAMLLR